MQRCDVVSGQGIVWRARREAARAPRLLSDGLGPRASMLGAIAALRGAAAVAFVGLGVSATAGAATDKLWATWGQARAEHHSGVPEGHRHACDLVRWRVTSLGHR